MTDKFENVNKSRKQIITNNFLGGISWGIGVTLGLALFIGILTIIASKINLVPIVGDFISEVIKYIISQSPTNI